MIAYIIRRLFIAISTILVLIVASFFLMHFAPGGPFTSERPLPSQVLANIEARYGLDQPLWKQLYDYLFNIIVHFDFGPSFKFKDRDVSDIIAQGFPISFTYGSLSFLAATFVGVSLGTVAAICHNTWIDYFAVGLVIAAQALPNFIMGPILILTFTLWLGLLLGGGWNGGQWQYLIMPVIALSTLCVGSPQFHVRSSELQLHPNRPCKGAADPHCDLAPRTETNPAAGGVLPWSCVSEPYTSLGSLISEGAGTMAYGTLWQLAVPLFLYVTIVVTMFFIGDGLRGALDPYLRVGEQMREVLQVHEGITGRVARQRCLDWPDQVRIGEAKRRLDQFPHELFGGMRQRVMIAMSMLCCPRLLIADEPTTALDVTVLADILDLMAGLQKEQGTAIALIPMT